MSPSMMMKIKAMGYWTSQSCDWDAGQKIRPLPTSGVNRWGTLKFKQLIPDTNASVKIDILDASNNSVLVSDLGEIPTSGDVTIDLKPHSDTLNTKDIKVKFKLYMIENTPEVDDIDLRFEITG